MYDEPEHAQDRFLMVAQKFGSENHSSHLHFELHFKNLTKHSDNIFFHRWGIGEVDSDALYQRAMRDYAYRKKYGDKKLDELRKKDFNEAVAHISMYEYEIYNSIQRLSRLWT